MSSTAEAEHIDTELDASEADGGGGDEGGGAQVDPQAVDAELVDAVGEAAPEAEVIELDPPAVLELRALLAKADSDNAALAQERNELKERLRAVSQAYQKQQEEVEATKERLKRQAVVQEELRRGEVVASIFEPVENLRRSLDAAKRGASAEDTVVGLDLVLKEFMTAFASLGLEEVPGKGAKFDPNIHEALTTCPVPDEALHDAVVDVFAAGYRIGNRLIRPAKVIVGAWTAPIGEA
jgi:molecular chaperone GrpE